MNVPLGRAVHPVSQRETWTHRDRIQIVYAMEVIDPVARRDGARYVRRFTFETREEAWAKYSEAIRFGLEATVEEVGRMSRPRQSAPA